MININKRLKVSFKKLWIHNLYREYIDYIGFIDREMYYSS